MPTVPATEPQNFRAGDFLTWSKSLSEHPANDGWVLAYTLINAATKITINAVASGAEHLVSVAATSTANYAAGSYTWMARVTKGTEIYTVGTGTIEILPNLAALTTHDGRSHAKIVLEALEAAIRGSASRTQLEMSISGRQIRFLTPKELREERSALKAEIAQEAQAESMKKTGINPNNIGVRFRRV